MFGMSRKWINQPSKLQRHHGLHGKNVLVSTESLKNNSEFVRVFFTEGPVMCQIVSKYSLSEGWVSKER